jgi:hypothetical protein
MHVDRISLALTRIETAAVRIQQAAWSRGALAGHASAASDDEARYRALREEAASALAEIDQLILQLEQ